MINKSIKYYREQRDMSQAELGRRCNVSRHVVWAWENRCKGLDVKYLLPLCKALDVELSDLVALPKDADIRARKRKA